MQERHPLFKGAVILTGAGLISRFMGFFFRIFLSHTFGEESVGLYQLVFPVYAMCISIGTSGIQTALSRIVAEKLTAGRKKEALDTLSCALGLTVFFSFLEVLFIQNNASTIARSFLGDPRCENLILILSFALPFAAFHSCICGYSLGMQKTLLPAASQLVEQSFRIIAVITVCMWVYSKNTQPSILIAASGITAGELAASVVSALWISRHIKNRNRQKLHTLPNKMRELLSLSIPLTANRTAVTLLQSIEAASIPACLKIYGLSTEEALSMYGVLTGMALPCVLFPSAVTGSISTVLMPAVSSAKAEGNRSKILMLLRKSSASCLILGLACCLFFLIFGPLIGKILFNSSTAGRFIITLAWICPFLYTNSVLISAINGLGRTIYTFFISMAGLVIRIAGVFLAIPCFGIQGYLISLLISQLAVLVISVLVLIFGTKKPTKTL